MRTAAAHLSVLNVAEAARAVQEVGGHQLDKLLFDTAATRLFPAAAADARVGEAALPVADRNCVTAVIDAVSSINATRAMLLAGVDKERLVEFLKRAAEVARRRKELQKASKTDEKLGTERSAGGGGEEGGGRAH